jgi:hypothetical protein
MPQGIREWLCVLTRNSLSGASGAVLTRRGWARGCGTLPIHRAVHPGAPPASRDPGWAEVPLQKQRQAELLGR